MVLVDTSYERWKKIYESQRQYRGLTSAREPFSNQEAVSAAQFHNLTCILNFLKPIYRVHIHVHVHVQVVMYTYM